ncbi:hypothetical protein Rleg9DRAFT_0909 [Rhizobium leguminosarum bv. trifolii WSM597]|uniref:Uncharacterized protein n=1 Tax=Rhizobium leguminosarum bv. trifolii WSM597 TaxID=754764 RepID=I9N2K8_RHILT|nr:hypothetical protein [Rhizobium leguminosarum]EJB02129.1 hypothetical protein Rleg9DRAFT_0909 [Rhizobium leguminosarum bv. trifolii WSM597]
MSTISLRDLAAPECEALLEKLALTLERNADWAATEGDDELEALMRVVGSGILSVAHDLAAADIFLVEDVAARAVSLITTFHVKYPHYPIGPNLH